MYEILNCFPSATAAHYPNGGQQAITKHRVREIFSRCFSSERAKLIYELASFHYPWADRVTAVSKGVADDVAQLTAMPRERIVTIYNPVFTPRLLEQAAKPLTHPWFEKGQPPAR